MPRAGFWRNSSALKWKIWLSFRMRPAASMLFCARFHFNAAMNCWLPTTNTNASRNALNFAAERSGARVVVAPIPFPFQSAEEIVGPILERVTRRTKLVLVDQVTSQTGIVLPVGKIVKALRARGVDTLVDGAHAPEWFRWICGNSVRRITPAIAINGSAHQKEQRSCTCGATNKKGFVRLRSATAPTRGAKIGRVFTWSLTGREQQILQPG